MKAALMQAKKNTHKEAGDIQIHTALLKQSGTLLRLLLVSSVSPPLT